MTALVDPHALWTGLAVAAAIAAFTWLCSLACQDVSLVDIAWAAMVAASGLALWLTQPEAASHARGVAVSVLVLAWALRLALHIGARHAGEDRRYQEIRRRNEPGFAFRSLYLVFGLQAVLAWIVGWAPAAALRAPDPVGFLDAIGLALAVSGAIIEALADLQLTRFRRDPGRQQAVMRDGLWRYSRHPNYFGEFCFWWGIGIVALGAGAWWALASPLLMSVLLLRVSGVTLLEKGIADRRPGYRDYVRRTNAFFPGRPR